ncbi:hypothetical protein ACJMK2_013616, partial [Sinanodonta woodiana]
FFKTQIHPHVSDIQQMNQELDILKDMYPVAAESLLAPADEVNTKWDDVIRGIGERQ